MMDWEQVTPQHHDLLRRVPCCWMLVERNGLGLVNVTIRLMPMTPELAVELGLLADVEAIV